MKPAARVLTCFAVAFFGTCAYAAEGASASAPATAPMAKPDPAKGATISANVCAACHTNDGTRGSPANPILQGQHADYLVKELTDFKSGKRVNAIMNGMAATLSNDDMKNVAAFYASKNAKPGFAKDKTLAALGQKIYRGGIAARAIPACAACHGPSGAGIPVQYPRLSGQQAEYVEAQLIAFRGGVRRNNAAMTGVAAKLGDREIKALADYVAGLR
ncbi:MAG: cytochrome c4 [Pseudomonadota bacterium]|nr:cytochrome c4 [Pseudomonadota bacterium]